MLDGPSQLLADFWAFTKTALWNLSMATYGVIVLLWQISFWLFSWPSIAPSDHPERFAIAAIAIGSFVAYRDARIDARWDREALSFTHFSASPIPEEYGGPYIHTSWTFVANDGVTIPYPQEIRLRFSDRPGRVSAKVEDPDYEYMGTTVDSDSGRIRMEGRTAFFSAFPPSLNNKIPLRIDVESREPKVACHLEEIAVRRFE